MVFVGTSLMTVLTSGNLDHLTYPPEGSRPVTCDQNVGGGDPRSDLQQQEYPFLRRDKEEMCNQGAMTGFTYTKQPERIPHIRTVTTVPSNSLIHRQEKPQIVPYVLDGR